MRAIFDINHRHKHKFTEQNTLCLLVPKVKLRFAFVLVYAKPHEGKNCFVNPFPPRGSSFTSKIVWR